MRDSCEFHWRGDRWVLNVVDHVDADDSFGSCDFESRVVLIRRNHESRRQMIDTIIHELFHATDAYMPESLRLSDERERTVLQSASMVASVLAELGLIQEPADDQKTDVQIKAGSKPSNEHPGIDTPES